MFFPSSRGHACERSDGRRRTRCPHGSSSAPSRPCRPRYSSLRTVTPPASPSDVDPTVLSPIACAGLLVGSFVVGGACQSAWFAHPLSKRFTRPLDGGRTFRGRRILGDNKTTRGFVVIVPATALAMAGLGLLA